MTSTLIEVSPAATLTGGLLAGCGRLHAALSIEEVVEELAQLRHSPSCWEPSAFADDAAAEAQMAMARQPLVGWERPDASLVGLVADVLEEGWRLAGLTPRSSWAPPALRFKVDGSDAARALHDLGVVDGWRIVGHVGLSAGRVAWTWPLRVFVADDVTRARLIGQFHGSLYHVVDSDPGDGVDIAVVDPATVGALDGVLATLALVVGADGWDPAELLGRATRMGLAGVLTVGDAGVDGLVDALIAELSHDEPLDVAASIVAPDAILYASRELIGLSSIRAWADFVASHVGTVPGGEDLAAIFRDTVRTRPFDHESGGGTAVATAAGEMVAQDALRAITTIKLDMSSALPPSRGEPELSREPLQPSPAPPSPVARDLEVILEEERRLQVHVRDASGATRRDGFVAGQRHELRVRIAAEESPDVVAASHAFVSPTPGQAAELTVVVHVRGQRGRPKRRKLLLPAEADSAWTKPIPIDVPTARTDAASNLVVEIIVLHEQRALQTALLSGPIVAAEVPAGEGDGDGDGLTLVVDADTPPTDLSARTPGSATLLVTVDVDGKPEVLDLSVAGRLLPADRLDRANKAVRRILLDAFLSPPSDLRSAAGVLTKLAVRGATLRAQLKGNDPGFHDDAPWIHIVSFGQANLPFELIYTHPLPDSDEEVPVCDAALGGSTGCAGDCPDRARSDRVCPFGFWGTSKVVERRLHIDHRSGAIPAPQRKVLVSAGAIVGTAKKMDEEDPRASSRVETAVARAMPAGRSRRVESWKGLATAMGEQAVGVLVLVTHTVKSADETDDLGVSLELGGDLRSAHRIDHLFVNPADQEPGPIVFSLGCDTGDLDVGYADWVATLHAAGAAVVVSTLSPVPGREVANFVERLFATLPQELSGPPPHSCGAVLTAVRRATIATGDVLALSITASGDGDVQLVGAT